MSPADAGESLMSDPDRFGRTDALLVRRGGESILELYGEGTDSGTTLKSWSMAKSMLHAAVGILVAGGRLDPGARADVPEWSNPADPRHEITLWDLLRMRPGLRWNEDYVDGEGSDVIEMLFGRDWEPVADTGGFAAANPLVARPGSVLNYSSGTSNIVSRIVAELVGRGDEYQTWLQQNLFGPVGMDSAIPRFDEVGTWIASSYCFCTASDFARFGELYLHDGCVGDRRVLPPEWVRTARTTTGVDEDGRAHSAHWWVWDDNPWGAFNCSGYEGQYVVVVPALDSVVVRLGQTDTSLRDNVVAELTEVIAGIDA